jgi:hypothetical protein
MNPKKAQQNTFPYSTVEAALCIVFEIGDDDLVNFRSRIRHLRNIGVPRDLSRPGSGRKTQYTYDQVLQLSFALCLQEYGVRPELAANFGPDIASCARWPPRGSDDLYAVFRRVTQPREPTTGMIELLFGFEQLQRSLKEQFVDFEQNARLVLNASNLMRRVEQALKEGE